MQHPCDCAGPIVPVLVMLNALSLLHLQSWPCLSNLFRTCSAPPVNMSVAVTPSQNVLTITNLQASVRCPALLQSFTVITTLAEYLCI